MSLLTDRKGRWLKKRHGKCTFDEIIVNSCWAIPSHIGLAEYHHGRKERDTKYSIHEQSEAEPAAPDVMTEQSKIITCQTQTIAKLQDGTDKNGPIRGERVVERMGIHVKNVKGTKYVSPYYGFWPDQDAVGPPSHILQPFIAWYWSTVNIQKAKREPN